MRNIRFIKLCAVAGLAIAAFAITEAGSLPRQNAINRLAFNGSDGGCTPPLKGKKGFPTHPDIVRVWT